MSNTLTVDVYLMKWPLSGQVERVRIFDTTYQVDIKDGSVITVHVHIHCALLPSQADGAVLHGEGGGGRSILSKR